MIDLHAHILAGIDDGAQTLDDAIAMLKNAEQQGVKLVLATPHINLGTFDNDLFIIEEAFQTLKRRALKEHIGINIAYAAEVRIDPDIILMAKNKQLPYVGEYQGKDILLLEFPHSHIPPGSDQLIFWLAKQNIRPLIAHPERNRDAWGAAEKMLAFKQNACLFQITAGSLLGDFGPHAERLAWLYLQESKNCIVASDMHSNNRRPCKMAQAFEKIKSRLGSLVAEATCINLPYDLIESNLTISSV